MILWTLYGGSAIFNFLITKFCCMRRLVSGKPVRVGRRENRAADIVWYGIIPTYSYKISKELFVLFVFIRNQF